MSKRHPMKNRFAPAVLTPIAAALALSLTACGGGGGSAAGAGTSVKLKGAAIDAPLSGATITITSGAPQSARGTVLGTVTADAYGDFTLAGITLPSGSVPIFANATTAPTPQTVTVALNSYLGQSDALAAAGSLTTGNLPDLDISPVTTAALAVYGQVNGGNGSYASLTPAGYATTLMANRSAILAIAAGVKAVGDDLCTPTPNFLNTAGGTTSSLAAALALDAQADLSNGSTTPSGGTSTTLSIVANALGGTCAAALAALPGEIAADPDFGPELDLGDVIDANVAPVVTAGTYQLEGVVAEIPALAAANGPGIIPTVNPAAPFADATIAVDANGNISSTDNKVSGTIIGNLMTLSVTISPAQQYNLRLKLGVLPATLVSNGPAYVIEGGGANSSTGALTNFEAVLAATTTSGNVTTFAALPVWSNLTTTPSQSEHGTRCTSGFAIRLDASFFGVPAAGSNPGADFSADFGGSFGECVTSGPAPAVWTMSPPAMIPNGEDFGLDGSSGRIIPSLSATPFSAPTWTEVVMNTTPTTTLPFVLASPSASYTPPARNPVDHRYRLLRPGRPHHRVFRLLRQRPVRAARRLVRVEPLGCGGRAKRRFRLQFVRELPDGRPLSHAGPGTAGSLARNRAAARVARDPGGPSRADGVPQGPAPLGLAGTPPAGGLSTDRAPVRRSCRRP